MNPKQFLIIGGAVLLLVGILGFIGPIGPDSEASLFGMSWWFDNAENIAHLVLGVVGLIAAFVFPHSIQKPLVILLGLFGLATGIYSALGPITEGKNLLGAQLQNPADTILHVVVGLWALLAAFMGKSSIMMSDSGMMQKPGM